MVAPDPANYYGVPLANFVGVIYSGVCVVGDDDGCSIRRGHGWRMYPGDEIVSEKRRERVARNDVEMARRLGSADSTTSGG